MQPAYRTLRRAVRPVGRPAAIERPEERRGGVVGRPKAGGIARGPEVQRAGCTGREQLAWPAISTTSGRGRRERAGKDWSAPERHLLHRAPTAGPNGRPVSRRGLAGTQALDRNRTTSLRRFDLARTPPRRRTAGGAAVAVAGRRGDGEVGEPATPCRCSRRRQRFRGAAQARWTPRCQGRAARRAARQPAGHAAPEADAPGGADTVERSDGPPVRPRTHRWQGRVLVTLGDAGGPNVAAGLADGLPSTGTGPRCTPISPWPCTPAGRRPKRGACADARELAVAGFGTHSARMADSGAVMITRSMQHRHPSGGRDRRNSRPTLGEARVSVHDAGGQLVAAGTISSPPAPESRARTAVRKTVPRPAGPEHAPHDRPDLGQRGQAAPLPLTDTSNRGMPSRRNQLVQPSPGEATAAARDPQRAPVPGPSPGPSEIIRRRSRTSVAPAGRLFPRRRRTSSTRPLAPGSRPCTRGEQHTVVSNRARSRSRSGRHRRSRRAPRRSRRHRAPATLRRRKASRRDAAVPRAEEHSLSVACSPFARSAQRPSGERRDG